MSDGPWVCHMETIIDLWHNLLPWSYLCRDKKNHLHFHQNSSQDWCRLCWLHAALLPLGEFVIGFLSKEMVLRDLWWWTMCMFTDSSWQGLETTCCKYCSACTTPKAGHSSGLCYCHLCCWLYYMKLLTYGTYFFYPSNFLYTCARFPNSAE